MIVLGNAGKTPRAALNAVVSISVPIATWRRLQYSRMDRDSYAARSYAVPSSLISHGSSRDGPRAWTSSEQYKYVMKSCIWRVPGWTEAMWTVRLEQLRPSTGPFPLFFLNLILRTHAPLRFLTSNLDPAYPRPLNHGRRPIHALGHRQARETCSPNDSRALAR